MENTAPQRKLTTILVADIEGYSRLMSRDEEGTHARLAALSCEVVEPAIAAREGTLIKTTGDGFLAEFASVVEAMRCALHIQQGAAERNAGLPPEQHMAFRIGVNLGDVIAAAGDIFGDGVNVAARLEQLAEPGGIVVSRAVRDHVRDRLNLTFDDLGFRAVKNIARPVRAFGVRTEGDPQRRSSRSLEGGSHRRALAGAAVAAALIGL